MHTRTTTSSGMAVTAGLGLLLLLLLLCSAQTRLTLSTAQRPPQLLRLLRQGGSPRQGGLQELQELEE